MSAYCSPNRVVLLTTSSGTDMDIQACIQFNDTLQNIINEVICDVQISGNKIINVGNLKKVISLCDTQCKLVKYKPVTYSEIFPIKSGIVAAILPTSD